METATVHPAPPEVDSRRKTIAAVGVPLLLLVALANMGYRALKHGELDISVEIPLEIGRQVPGFYDDQVPGFSWASVDTQPDHEDANLPTYLVCEGTVCTGRSFSRWRSGQRVEFRIRPMFYRSGQVPLAEHRFSADECRAIARRTFIFPGTYESERVTASEPSPAGGCFFTLP